MNKPNKEQAELALTILKEASSKALMTADDHYNAQLAVAALKSLLECVYTPTETQGE